MLGIVIATHGGLSDGLKDAAEVIIGNIENTAIVNLYPGDDVNELGGKIGKAIHEVDEGDGVAVLVDLISASPYNQSVLTVSQLENELLQKNVLIIGGANLPILLEIINHQMLSTPIEKVSEAVLLQAKNSVCVWQVCPSEEDSEDDNDDF